MLLTTEVIAARNKEHDQRKKEDEVVRKQEEEERRKQALKQMQAAADGNAVSTGASADSKSGPITRHWTYDYDGEPFKVEGKRFWPLHELEWCRKNFFKTLAHENDGLILQV